MHSLLVRGITKTYGYTHVLKDVSFDVPHGSVFAVVGFNGAGKTTLSQILAGELQATNGRLELDGESLGVGCKGVAKAKPLGAGTSMELLEAVAANLRGMPAPRVAARNALAQVGIAGATLTKHVGRLTPWEAIRAEAAAAIARRPCILVLDELDARLPAEERQTYWDLANDLADMGLTVLAATQDPRQAAAACSHAAVLVRGDLRFGGPLTQLGRSTDAIADSLAELQDPRRRDVQLPTLEPLDMPPVAAAAA